MSHDVCKGSVGCVYLPQQFRLRWFEHPPPGGGGSEWVETCITVVFKCLLELTASMIMCQVPVHYVPTLSIFLSLSLYLY